MDKELKHTESEMNDDVLAGMKVLIVEDNELNREIAATILEEEGILVEEAWDGAVAVEKMAAAEPGWYQLVLMDIQMPVMDGWQAARAIRSLEDPVLAGVPIIALSANAFEEDVALAKDAGMNEHLAKPVDIEKMIQVMSRLRGGR